MRAKEIRELVKIIEESNINEIEITRWWGRKIRISKAVSATIQTPNIQVTNSPQPAPPPPITSQTIQTEPTQEAPAKAEEQKESNLIEIRAPMVGTFYRAPAPDAQPYVKEGDMISPGKVLCIIEAMKLMNEIEAEISGQIKKILVENAQPVEFNQPLFLVEPTS